MANSAQVRKRIRQSLKRHARASAVRSRVRTHIKKVRAALQEGGREKALAAYREAVCVLDRAAAKHIVSPNMVARQKSHLNARIRALD